MKLDNMKIELTTDTQMIFELELSKPSLEDTYHIYYKNLGDARDMADWKESQGYKVKLFIRLES